MKYENESSLINFNNFGLVEHKFSKAELLPIQQEVDEIKNNFDAHIEQKYNYKLAGNIQHEYKLIKCHEYVEELIFPLTKTYDDYFKNYIKFNEEINCFKSKIVLGDLWVNFQKKYEFNPPHTHGGIFSFVIWLNIPYYIENELQNISVKETRDKLAAHFSFSYINTLGQISQLSIPADKNMEGTCCLFPSSFTHCVYPFYTSDEYRVTISGNFYFDKVS